MLRRLCIIIDHTTINAHSLDYISETTDIKKIIKKILNLLIESLMYPFYDLNDLTQKQRSKDSRAVFDKSCSIEKANETFHNFLKEQEARRERLINALNDEEEIAIKKALKNNPNLNKSMIIENYKNTIAKIEERIKKTPTTQKWYEEDFVLNKEGTFYGSYRNPFNKYDSYSVEKIYKIGEISKEDLKKLRFWSILSNKLWIEHTEIRDFDKLYETTIELLEPNDYLIDISYHL